MPRKPRKPRKPHKKIYAVREIPPEVSHGRTYEVYDTRTGIGGESFYGESDALKNAKEGNRIDGAFERKHGRRNTGDKPL